MTQHLAAPIIHIPMQNIPKASKDICTSTGGLQHAGLRLAEQGQSLSVACAAAVQQFAPKQRSPPNGSQPWGELNGELSLIVK